MAPPVIRPTTRSTRSPLRSAGSPAAWHSRVLIAPATVPSWREWPPARRVHPAGPGRKTVLRIKSARGLGAEPPGPTGNNGRVFVNRHPSAAPPLEPVSSDLLGEFAHPFAAADHARRQAEGSRAPTLGPHTNASPPAAAVVGIPQHRTVDDLRNIIDDLGKVVDDLRNIIDDLGEGQRWPWRRSRMTLGKVKDDLGEGQG